MINKVIITNYIGESLELELRNPEKSGLAVLKIEGLEPPKADISMTELITDDGALYNSARANSRNIVFSFLFLGKPSIEETRLLTYKFFPLKHKVKMIFETDNRTCETSGYVESNTPNIFSKKEGTKISIVCPDSFLYSAGKSGTQTTVFTGLSPNFEFPFSNESIVDNLMEFGVINTGTEKPLFYKGDGEVGVTIFIEATGDVHNLTITNTRTKEKMSILSDKLIKLTGYDIKNEDQIIISTVKRNKYVKLIRDKKEINILNCIDKNSDWFKLSKGDNIFSYIADTGIGNLRFRIENQILYEGV